MHARDGAAMCRVTRHENSLVHFVALVSEKLESPHKGWRSSMRQETTTVERKEDGNVTDALKAQEVERMR